VAVRCEDLVHIYPAADGDVIALRSVDLVVEPVRSNLIPGFVEVKRAALEAGAHGCSISGAGPALFAVTSAEAAERVALAMHAAFQRHGLPARHFICAPDNRGARRLD